MIKRVKDAFSKALFCIGVSGNPATFLKLIWHTKQFSLYKAKHTYKYAENEPPVVYQFTIHRQQHNVHLRIWAGDIAVFYEIFWLGVYNIPQLRFESFNTIVDVGANVGLATLFFSSKAPNAKVFAIEPDAQNFSVLQQNLKSELVKEKVTAIQAAISNQDEVVHLAKSKLAYNSSIANSASGHSVEAISINSLMQLYKIEKIDLLKIDVEGFEQYIFKDNMQWLHQVENILIEIHSQKDYETCMQAFNQYHFQVQRLQPVSAGIEHVYWAYRAA